MAAVAARVNHGRWIVDCPDCPNAQLLRHGQGWSTEFRCGNCGSGPHDVDLPDDRSAIDTALGLRPEVNRNWSPGETVEDLQVENTEHGVA